MRVEQIEVGKTYEGASDDDEVAKTLEITERAVRYNLLGFTQTFTCTPEQFARWAVREVPHAN